MIDKRRANRNAEKSKRSSSISFFPQLSQTRCRDPVIEINEMKTGDDDDVRR